MQQKLREYVKTEITETFFRNFRTDKCGNGGFP